jgi:hypothetical protein
MISVEPVHISGGSHCQDWTTSPAGLPENGPNKLEIAVDVSSRKGSCSDSWWDHASNQEIAAARPIYRIRILDPKWRSLIADKLV